MKVTQEKLPASQVGLEIEIPSEMSQKAYEKTIQELARTAQIPGFRKGKVPRQVLLQRFGSTRIKASALEELIQNGIEQAIAQEKIAALGNYQLRSDINELLQKFTPGEPLTISAAVDVQPEVQLKQYTGLELKAEEVKPDLTQVDQVLQQRQNERATLIPVEDRAAQMGDVVVIDFEGTLKPEGGEEKPVPGGQAQDFELELAEGKFIAGFVEGIVGMQPGETKELALQFPEDYPQPDLSGQPAAFSITLKELKEKELPELNDEFAQEVSEFQTLEELRASLETRYQEEAQNRTKTNKEQAILKELVNQVEVDLPVTLVDREIDYMLTQVAMQFESQGLDYRKIFTRDSIPELRANAQPEAVNRLKRTLALQEIAKRESLSLEESEIEQRVNELMGQYRDRPVDEQRLREVVEEDLLKDKILAWLEAHSTLELVPEGTLAAEAEAEAEVPEAVFSTAPESGTTIDVEATSEPESETK